MARGYGLLPSPPSKNDYEAEQLLGAAGIVPPPQFEKLLPFVSIKSQGPTNTCVWFSIAQAIRGFLKYRGAAVPEEFWPSPLFGYYNTLVNQGTDIVDRGCMPRIALQTLTDLGFCDEADWKFEPARVLKQPLPDAYTQAADQKLITHYYRLFSVGDQLVYEIKQALAQGFPVIYGSPVDATYEANSGQVLAPPTGPWLGSHMRCLVGYNEYFAIEANSWGDDWGNSGFGYISWDFIKWDFCHDFWVFDGVPTPTG